MKCVDSRLPLADISQELMRACCCPTFIVSISGPWIVIQGAVFTTQAIVDCLTDNLWLGRTRAQSRVISLARVFHALRLSISELTEYYNTLDIPALAPDSRYFPHFTSYTAANGERVTFRYIRPLEPQDPWGGSFLAVSQTPDGRDDKQLVIKYVDQYGENAHAHLASQGLAPELLHCSLLGNGYGDFRIVAIQYLPGKSAALAYAGRNIHPSIRETVRRAALSLHDQNMVHGDLRRPNVIIVNGPPGEDVGSRTRVIDFDWAGEVGKAKYPFDLSPEINWPDGVMNCGLIETQHDMIILNVL